MLRLGAADARAHQQVCVRAQLSRAGLARPRAALEGAPLGQDPQDEEDQLADVAAVVEHLKATLGATWAQASVPRQQANSLLVNPPRTPKPWVSRDRKVAANGGRDCI